ncbi:hypothetical protein PHYBLDRAFT_61747 [Phycomyces blakesleeanus NRRL 1555(-)]|uniref:Uncharacterized protein n=1 Tax=Phycomyces blakesleeanus (strain ATCC 8743b / DSM 1359 / FGSC 10004 / NBRC 33097 / NRRL 1555) TaxID=763407 RepID=A0A167R2F9_PHYB8|nr:hypothetical protein PHYBLDRAFT_61747 [Phycomyces blakesleeanus NRRL 1555(-)]OAD80694.1 hypothetical protein PHYBLDRAFT_61747 [Phycomyces blakesleeanus NRRL 1555(-)]|eukprot:XP_018298734.1 hypothetical protein PHYBLDRAFT_61747 [Phycomyces blakesleeanus NRRL 1555(-)]
MIFSINSTSLTISKFYRYSSLFVVRITVRNREYDQVNLFRDLLIRNQCQSIGRTPTKRFQKGISFNRIWWFDLGQRNISTKIVMLYCRFSPDHDDFDRHSLGSENKGTVSMIVSNISISISVGIRNQIK